MCAASCLTKLSKVSPNQVSRFHIFIFCFVVCIVFHIFSVSEFVLYSTGREAILLHVLSNMFYGFCDSGTTQFLIYCTMLELAARSGLTRSIITDIGRVNCWFDQWALPVEDKRKCLRLLHTALGKVWRGLLLWFLLEFYVKVHRELINRYLESTNRWIGAGDVWVAEHVQNGSRCPESPKWRTWMRPNRVVRSGHLFVWPSPVAETGRVAEKWHEWWRETLARPVDHFCRWQVRGFYGLVRCFDFT